MEAETSRLVKSLQRLLDCDQATEVLIPTFAVRDAIRQLTALQKAFDGVLDANVQMEQFVQELEQKLAAREMLAD